MTISRHDVSLRSYTLAFAVALSPALLQTSSCGSMYTLTELQLIVDGQDRVDGFAPDIRRYDIALPVGADTALVRAVPTNPSAEVWLYVEHVSSEPVTTPSIVGGGEFPITLESGHTTLTLHVKEGPVGSFYTVGIQAGPPFACTELGIRGAIAWGGGPHTLDCDGPTTIVTNDTIVIDNDVILDGGGMLTIDGDFSGHAIFSVFPADVTAELQGLTISGGGDADCICVGRGCCFVSRGAVENAGALTLVSSSVLGNVSGIHSQSLLTIRNTTVSANGWLGISNSGEAAVVNSIVSSNAWSYPDAGGIVNSGVLTLTNSTVSTNENVDIENHGTLTLTNSTVSAGEWGILNWGTATVANSTLSATHWACGGSMTSLGHNIESPGNTCGFDQATDQVNVPATALNLGPLQDNGGPTMTHELLTTPTVSVAIDQIPEADCVDADGVPLTTDQRGFTRPVAIVGPDPKCDVGAFEVQP